MNVIAIIPAKGFSSRLANKNYAVIWDKPMVEWVIGACKESNRITDIYVSTDCDDIREIAGKCNVKIVDRPHELAGNTIYKQQVIRQVADTVSVFYDGETIWLSIQPNSPQLQGRHFDEAIELLETYNKDEIFSVDGNGMQNAAFRVFRGDYVFQTDLSTNVGTYFCDVDDIHTQEDLEHIEKQGRSE